MPQDIGIHEIQAFLREGAQLVDVLPGAEFEEEHLPGAVNIPLKKMTPEAVSVLDPNRAVIVYCHDYQ